MSNSVRRFLPTRIAVPLTGVPSRWATAPVSVALATAANFWMQSAGAGRAPFLPFFPAIIATGFLAGIGPGIAAILLSAVAADFYWMDPAGSLSVARPSDVAALATFILAAAVALAISAFARWLLIEARRTREDLNRALQAMRDADHRKDEFLATLAHELRNPMAPIRYAAASLRTGMPEQVLQQLRNVIERQAAHMARLLDDLLDLSRVTRNAIELRCTALDVRNVVSEAAETARPMLTNLQHRLVLSLPPEPVTVYGDSARLGQVIGNLIHNAAKYSEPGGQIDIALECTHGHAVVQVKDRGIGLAPEMLPRVFDPFSQLHKSLRVNKGGLGIGLTVARRLVELHDGTIEAHSKGLHQGAQFTVRLPLTRLPVDSPGRCPDQRSGVPLLGSQSPHVLVVDDNADAAETLAEVLRNEGCSVAVAFDGAAAQLAFERKLPSVVVLDLGLPDMNGEELARHIRRYPQGKSVRIVAVTGWGQERDRERSREAGVDFHLLKPVDPDALMQILSQPIERNAELHSMRAPAAGVGASGDANGLQT